MAEVKAPKKRPASKLTTVMVVVPPALAEACEDAAKTKRIPLRAFSTAIARTLTEMASRELASFTKDPIDLLK